jgi:hypothetical protein
MELMNPSWSQKFSDVTHVIKDLPICLAQQTLAREGTEMRNSTLNSYFRLAHMHIRIMLHALQFEMYVQMNLHSRR